MVLADAVALPHLIASGEEGYLVHPRNAHEYAERIERILHLDSDAYRVMSRAALATALTHDAGAMTSRYEQLYRESWTLADAV